MELYSNHKILVVDDEEEICELISDMLNFDGYDCSAALDVDQALELLSKEPYSLVISDINMPGKTGIDLLGIIKTDYPDTAVIMETAINDREVAISTLEQGAYAYLIKPFSRNELLINVINTLRRRELEINNKRYGQELERLIEERTAKLKLAELEIRQTQKETIHRLAMAAEFRDDETARHTIRVGEYCMILAKALGFPDEYCERIRLASPLHDIGKIGISDTVLLKPGKLTDEEYDLIKQHPEMGHRILDGSTSELLKMGAIIALNHHEKFDGTGYPQGLSGEKIPIEGRISAICDVFDALTSNRVYKAAASADKAIEIMKKDSGTHFDNKLMELFLDNIDQILKTKKKFADTPA